MSSCLLEQNLLVEWYALVSSSLIVSLLAEDTDSVMSSANCHILAFTDLGSSLIRMLNSRGLRQLPWGTPLVTGFQGVRVLSCLTLCCLLVRKL